MSRSPVRVLLRTRPATRPNENLRFLEDGKGVVVIPKVAPDQKSYAAQGGAGHQYYFKFDGVLNDVAQEAVYEAAAVEVVQGALQGYNGTVMCYGQTGAGKTYTMSGGRQQYKQRGLIPRVLTQLFSEIRGMPGHDVKVSIQYLEIYNENLYDLLDITTQPHEINVHDVSGARTAAVLGVPSGQISTVSITGLRTVTVATEADALALLFEGETNRVIGEHQLNRESSRSHSIFTISLEIKGTNDPLGVVMASKLNLVDLAGSERVSKTKSEGAVLKEAGYINKSLSFLEQVVVALSERGRDHVPFRSSRLTHVLKDSLGGNSRTVLVANVWGEGTQIEETLSTCRFAQRMMRVNCEVSANIQEDNSAKVKMLQRQIVDLQAELAMHDAMSGRSGVSYAPYSEEQRAMLKDQVEAFLSSPLTDSIEPLELISLRHMREILLTVKAKYQSSPPPPPPASTSAVSSSRSQTNPDLRHALPPLDDGSAPAGDEEWLDRGATDPESPGVGELDGGSSGQQAGGVGIAPDSTPGALQGADDDAGNSAMERLMSMQASDSSPSPGPGKAARSGGGALTVHTGPPPDIHTALDQFRYGPGSVTSQLLAENRGRLRASKKKAKELGLSINSAKQQLDTLKVKADALKAARIAKGGEAAQVLEPDELDVVGRIKEVKQQYKDQFGELQMVRSEVDYTQQLCDTCSKELAKEFKDWYLHTYGVAAPGDMADDDLEGGGQDGSQAALLDPSSPSAASTAPSHTPSSAITTGAPAAHASPRIGGNGIGAPTGAGAGHVRRGPVGSTQSVAAFPSPSRPRPAGGTFSSTAAGGGGGTLGVRGGTTAGPAAVPRASASPARRPPVAGSAPRGATGGGVGGPPPLAPPPVPDPGELNDPEAAAFYAAQQQLISKTQGVAHRPGSVKKGSRAPTTFSVTERAHINARTFAEVNVRPGAAAPPKPAATTAARR